jgi:hypothetical protein
MARRLGWLGPAVVLVGIAIAAVGVWFVVRSKPSPGEVIDTFDIDPRTSIVIRAERSGTRAFVEQYVDKRLAWQALIPPYAGRKGKPAVAWSRGALSVRVIRDRRAEIFALAMNDASKLGGIHLAAEHGPIEPDAPGPLTLTDHVRSYEILSGSDWHQLATIDLGLGKVVWKRELGPTPIDAAGLDGGLIWIQQAGVNRRFRVFTGAEDATNELPVKPM